MGVPLQVADERVDVEEGLAVQLAATQRAVHGDFLHPLHHGRQGEVYAFGQLHGGQVVVGGMQAVQVGIDIGLLYQGQAADGGIEKQGAVLAKGGHHILCM